MALMSSRVWYRGLAPPDQLSDKTNVTTARTLRGAEGIAIRVSYESDALLTTASPTNGCGENAIEDVTSIITSRYFSTKYRHAVPGVSRGQETEGARF